MDKLRKGLLTLLALILLCSFDYMQDVVYASNVSKSLLEATFEETLNEAQSEADIKMNLTYDTAKVNVNKIVHPDKEEIGKKEEALLSTMYHVIENKTYDFEVFYTNIETLEEKQETFSYEMKTLKIEEVVKPINSEILGKETLETEKEKTEKVTPTEQEQPKTTKETSNTLEHSTRAATTFPKKGMVFWDDETEAALKPPGYSGAPGILWAGSKLYWGVNEGAPMKWRILNTEERSFGVNTGGILIMSDDVSQMGKTGTSFNSSGVGNNYSGSELETYIDGKFNTFLDPKEQSATLNSTKIENDYELPAFSSVIDKYKDNFSDKKWFAPTMRMMFTERYGYQNLDEPNAARASGGWHWLSSTYVDPQNTKTVGIVSATGALHAQEVQESLRVVSASQLNPYSILFVSNALDTNGKNTGTVGPNALAEVKANSSGEYKLTLKDRSQIVTVLSTTYNSTNLATITYNKDGPGTKLSAIVTDSTGNNIISYGQLANIGAGPFNNQTVNVQLPNDFFTSGYKLKVFTEIANGDKKTDYASGIVEAKLAFNKVHEIYYRIYPFDDYSITNELPSSFTSGSNLVIGAPKAVEGGTFKGWTGPNGETPQMEVTIPKDGYYELFDSQYYGFHANWDLKKYTVTYETDGGTLVDFGGTPISSAEVEFGRTIPGHKIMKEGHLFAGWYSEPTFETEWSERTSLVKSNVTLYAKWIQVSTATTKSGLMPWKSAGGGGGGLLNPQKGLESRDAWKGNYLYWGAKSTDAIPMKWRILNTNETGFGQENGILIMQNDFFQMDCLGYGVNPTGMITPYNNSNLVNVMNDKFSTSLDPREQNATLGSSKNATYVIDSANNISGIDQFENHKWFAPNFQMLLTSSYGFGDDSVDGNLTRNFEQDVWLSTEVEGSNHETFYIAGIGGFLTKAYDNDYAATIMAASQINPDSILFVSDAYDDVKNGTVNMFRPVTFDDENLEYKFTLKDNTQKIIVNSSSIDESKLLTINFNKTGPGTRLSAVIMDATEDNIFAYARIKDLDVRDLTNQTATIQLPDDFYEGDKKIKVFTEIANGERHTDYASNMEEAGKYTVIFESYGGTPIQSQSIRSGLKVTKPKDPMKDGYTFEGWYKEATFNNEWDFINGIVTEEMTLHAKWTPIPYNITYEMDGGTNHVSNPLTYTIEDEVTLNAPVKEGHTFKGWTYDGQQEPQFNVKIPKGSMGDITYTANWKINEYTVTFDSQSGSTVNPQTANYNTATSKPTDPTRDGYTFAGWYIDEGYSNEWDFSVDKVINNMILYAKWTPTPYDIIYEMDGGDNPTSNPTTYNIETETIILTAPTKVGHSFKGWTYDGETTPQSNLTIPKGSWGNKTYTAHWEIDTYTITFNSQSGSAVPAQTANYNTKTNKPTDPTREGYRFAGWYTEAGCITEWKFESDLVIKNMTLFAKWEKKFYITFVSNTGVGSMDKIGFYAPDVVVLPANTFTKDNYSFVGWNTKADGSGTAYLSNASLNGVFTSDTTLYATWKVDTPMVFIDIPLGLSLINDKANNIATSQNQVKLEKDSNDSAWYPEEDIHIRTNPNITLTSNETTDTYNADIYKADGTPYTDGTNSLMELNVKEETMQSSAFTLKTPINYSKFKGAYTGNMNFIVEFKPKP